MSGGLYIQFELHSPLSDPFCLSLDTCTYTHSSPDVLREVASIFHNASCNIVIQTPPPFPLPLDFAHVEQRVSLISAGVKWLWINVVNMSVWR